MPVSRQTALLKQFYKQTFELKKKGKSQYRHTLLVNPEDMSISEPARANVQQTLGGAYIADFGAGIHQVTVSGTTGYSVRYNADGQQKDGYMEIKDLRRKLYRNYIESQDKDLEMYWYNWEDEEYYQIIPTNFRVTRNKAEPTLYRYELTFMAVRRLDNAGAKKPQMDAEALTASNLVLMGVNLSRDVSAMSESRTRFG